MGLRSNFLHLLPLLLILLESTVKGQSGGGVFDVTKYGAKPNADITQVNVCLFGKPFSFITKTCIR